MQNMIKSFKVNIFLYKIEININYSISIYININNMMKIHYPSIDTNFISLSNLNNYQDYPTFIDVQNEIDKHRAQLLACQLELDVYRDIMNLNDAIKMIQLNDAINKFIG